MPAGEVVEEEERLGPLHQNVVDAHGHQVDADGVVHTQREGQLELGAHPVGPRHQHRLAVAGRNLEQPAKAPDARQQPRALRAGRQRLDPLDQCVARVDVDPGIPV